MNFSNENNFDEGNKIKIDEDLYSRQIIFLGMETMEKISKLKILIIGLRGLGVEIAKNIIVSGPNKVTIFDPNEVQIDDLGSNFYLTEKDIGKRRDESCLLKLQQLNKYVKLDYFKEKYFNDITKKIIGNFNVIVVSEIISKEDIIFIDDISRKNHISFIYTAICGLSSFVFTDFGPDFTIYDEYCFKKRKFYIKNIEKSEDGLVEIEWNNNRNPYIKDYILFKDVEGMTEINYCENNKKVFKIKPRDISSFYIGNTKNYSEYKSGGYIEETVIPKKVSYGSFLTKLEEPFINEDYYVNSKKKFVFLIFRALMDFFDKNKRLPFLNDLKDFEELRIITKNIFDFLDYDNLYSFDKDEMIFNENIIKNICFSATAEIPCMTSLIGGVVCQEIIKTTGKFRPIDQWEIFDFLQYSSIIPENEKWGKYNIIKNDNRYDELISVFGKNSIQKLQNSNILLAGAGALGCELLKNLALLGISNSVLVIDDDNIEISNLNRQILFHEEHKGLNKALIACKSAKQINSDLACNYISKRISPENKNIFNKSYFDRVDFVLGAIDSKEGNYYLVKQCELFEKIFIKGGTEGPAGKIEIFIPNMTCSYNDIQFKEEEEEKSPSCTRRQFPTKIEDCIDNARDLFDEYFVISIIDFLKIINENKIVKLEFEHSIIKFNLINKYIYFIKKKLEKNNDNDIKEIDKDFIYFGLFEFKRLFIDEIKKIFSEYPLNDSEVSKEFWKNKRIPSKLEFNIDDELHITFLFNYLKILSDLIDIPFINDLNVFTKQLKAILEDINYNNNNIDSLINDPELLYKKILFEINIIRNNSSFLDKIIHLHPTNFEKDIPELGHILFIHSYANLKAKTYKIPCCDKFYTLEYVGKIAPTTITSTAVVAGFICLQMIGIIINQLYFWGKDNQINQIDYDEIDDEELIENGLHNLSCNLKNNDFTLERIYEEVCDGVWNVNNLIPQKFSRWYKIEEDGNLTIKEFNQKIKEKYGINVTLILSAEDDRVIYQKISLKSKNKKWQEKQMKMEILSNTKLEDVYFNTAKKICKDYDIKNDIFLKVKGLNDYGTYIEFPVMKIKN